MGIRQQHRLALAPSNFDAQRLPVLRRPHRWLRGSPPRGPPGPQLLHEYEPRPARTTVSPPARSSVRRMTRRSALPTNCMKPRLRLWSCWAPSRSASTRARGLRPFSRHQDRRRRGTLKPAAAPGWLRKALLREAHRRRRPWMAPRMKAEGVFSQYYRRLLADPRGRETTEYAPASLKAGFEGCPPPRCWAWRELLTLLVYTTRRPRDQQLPGSSQALDAGLAVAGVEAVD